MGDSEKPGVKAQEEPTTSADEASQSDRDDRSMRDGEAQTRTPSRPSTPVNQMRDIPPLEPIFREMLAPMPIRRNTKVDKRLYLLGIPITLLLAIISQYGHTNFYLLPKMERTLAEPINRNNLKQLQWMPLSKSDIFSLSTPQPNSPKFGIGWYEKTTKKIFWRVQDVNSYSYEISDGYTFGLQNIRHGNLSGSFRWINSENTWTARVALKNIEYNKKEDYGVFFYFEGEGSERVVSINNTLLKGTLKVLGNISLSLDLWGDEINFSTFSWSALNHSVMENILFGGARVEKTSNQRVTVFYANIPNEIDWEFSFRTDKEKPFIGEQFFLELNARITEFDKKFENRFGLKEKNLPDFYINLGRTVLSALLNGRVYCNDLQLMNGLYNEQYTFGPMDTTIHWASKDMKASSLEDLLSPILVLKHYDANLALKYIESWFNMANEHLDIPSRISDSPIQLNRDIFPQIFFAFDQLFDSKILEDRRSQIEQLYPRIEKYARIIQKKMQTSMNGLFSWSQNSTFSLFGSFVKREGAHIDAQIWVHYTGKVMQRLSRAFGSNQEKLHWERILEEISKNWHQFETDGRFCDIEFAKIGKDHKTPTSKKFYNCKTGKAILPILLGLNQTSHGDFDQLLLELVDKKWLTDKGMKEEESSGGVNLIFNYWVLQSAFNHIQESGPHQSDAHQLYGKLRSVIISTMAQQFTTNGFLLDTFDISNTIKNPPRNPTFASLLLLILAEIY